jgi:hypothetical protein
MFPAPSLSALHHRRPDGRDEGNIHAYFPDELYIPLLYEREISDHRKGETTERNNEDHGPVQLAELGRLVYQVFAVSNYNRYFDGDPVEN